MRALLVLFMVDSVQNGGLGLTDQNATAIYTQIVMICGGAGLLLIAFGQYLHQSGLVDGKDQHDENT